MNASIKPAVVRTETIEVAPERVVVDMSRAEAEVLRAITAWPITIMTALTTSGVFRGHSDAGQRVLAELAVALDVIL